MRIDSTHRPWMIATLITLGCIAATFIGSMAASPDGPRGGSLTGIAYGVVGYGLMLYAALLGLRKKVPVWRVGRAQTWMRGHLWLGFLSLPLILFHCAFTWRGPLNSLLMVLLFITVASGILGAAVQHFVPNFMTRSVPLETIYEEIPHVRRQLCDEADGLAASISGSGDVVQTLQTEIDPVDRARFAAVYTHTIRPVLHQLSNGPTDSKFESLAPAFDSLRKMLPLDAHPILKDLESICEEQHQLERQRRIHLWLHGWLLVHVPLSVALLVLGAVHGVMALRY